MIYKHTVGRSYTAATAHNIAAQQHFHVQQTCGLFMIKFQVVVVTMLMLLPTLLLNATATYNRPGLCTHKFLVVTVQKLLTILPPTLSLTIVFPHQAAREEVKE